MAGAVVLAAFFALALSLNIRGMRDRILGEPAATSIASITVLPLQHVSVDPRIVKKLMMHRAVIITKTAESLPTQFRLRHATCQDRSGFRPRVADSPRGVDFEPNERREKREYGDEHQRQVPSVFLDH